jgi:hypothetical protein
MVLGSLLISYAEPGCKTARSGATTEVGAPAKQDWASTYVETCPDAPGQRPHPRYLDPWSPLLILQYTAKATSSAIL